MYLNEKEFLDSISNRYTKKGYRYGLKKFCDWFGKSSEDILERRRDDLTLRQNENLIDAKHRARRFEREIEKFHAYLVEKGYSTNSARNFTLGIIQLFRYYEMPVNMRTGSRVSRTVKTTRSFPLGIEHVRAMFNVADLRERVLLSMATDLGLRISDFRTIQKKDLPDLSQEPPVQFSLMTHKEKIIANGFLSAETVDLLNVYLKTIERNENAFVFPSNGNAISEDRIGVWLKTLAEKAGINKQGKTLSFHCFRKMFLSASIDSGIGLTAGKMLCGKSIPQSDDTYLTTVKLREKFLQLKKMLTIQSSPTPENGKRFEQFEAAIEQLQRENVAGKTVAEVMTKKVTNLERELVDALRQKEDLQPLVEFAKSFKSHEELETFLDLFKTSSRIRFPEQGMLLLSGVPDDKRVVVSEIVYEVFHKIWENLSRQALSLVLQRLEEKSV
ncbi:MAG: site-specific integrase [Candidatus Bathyarchaeota archaeon]